MGSFIGGGMVMNMAEATDLAVKMKADGHSYEQITEHLLSIGYVSPRTRRPIKSMMVRYMVTDNGKRGLGLGAQVQSGSLTFLVDGDLFARVERNPQIRQKLDRFVCGSIKEFMNNLGSYE